MLLPQAHYGKWHCGATQNPPAPPPVAYGLDDSATFNSIKDDPAAPPLDPSCPVPRAPPPVCNNSWWDATTTAIAVNHTVKFIEKAVREHNPFYVNTWLHMSHADLNPTPE